jgi:3-oxoacyl-[acyl-carrier protein] reductase
MAERAPEPANWEAGMDLGLRGRVALVTGGSEGIGRAVAIELAREGARTAICGRRQEALESAAAALRGAVPGCEVVEVAADLTRSEEVERLAESVSATLGPVEVLVNAVGRGHRALLESVSDDDWRENLDLNLLSAVRITRRLLPAMIEAGWGRIIHVAAVSGRQPSLGQLVSNVSKGALINFAKSLSNETAGSGVTVNVILPGRILSERIRREFSPEQIAQREEAIPMRRYGTPEEFAAAAVFLASTRASYITGAALAVDGGLVSSMF